jgi:hypothetical protein
MLGMKTASYTVTKPFDFAGVHQAPGAAVELNPAQAEWCLSQGLIAPPADPEPEKAKAARRGPASQTTPD